MGIITILTIFSCFTELLNKKLYLSQVLCKTDVILGGLCYSLIIPRQATRIRDRYKRELILLIY